MREFWESFKRKGLLYPVLCGLIFAVMLAVDLATKAWAARAANGVEGAMLGTIIPRLILLRYSENTGTAFSLFADDPVMMKVVTALTVLMILAVVVLFFTFFKENAPVRVALAFIEAGAVGNLYDRLALGYVRDFVDVSAFGFGICNIADFCVTFGGAALVFCLLFIGKDALFPIRRKWREQAEEERRKAAQDEQAAHAVGQAHDGASPLPAREEERETDEQGGDRDGQTKL